MAQRKAPEMIAEKDTQAGKNKAEKGMSAVFASNAFWGQIPNTANIQG